MHRHARIRSLVLALLAAVVLAALPYAPAAQAAPRLSAPLAPPALASSPAMAWNSFLGGSDQDYGNAVAVDGSGNIYVAGFSYATWGSPVRAYGGGASDGFVAKLDAAGNLIWHTFLGGTSGDNAESIAVDAAGNVYVSGSSSATWGTPIRPFQFYGNAFAAKLDSSGVLQWNTFLGGSAWFDHSDAIAVDGSGNVYLAGWSGATWGTPLHAFGGAYDGLVAKLDNSGTLLWHTYLGGSGYDYAYGIGVDGSGNVYVGGSSGATWGTPVQAHGGANDAYVAKLDPAGTLVWNTFLGGSGSDDGYAIAVDAAGSSYVGGASTGTWGAPLLTFAAGMDGFAAKVDGSGTLQWNTFLGGSDYEFGQAIDVDGNGVYVTGRSGATWGTPVQGHAGGDDVFAVKLDLAGALQWNTFLGGSGYDQGFGIATDGNNRIAIAGFTGAGWGTPQRAYSDGGDAFALQITDLPPAPEIQVVGNGVAIAAGDTTPDASDHTEFGGAALGGASIVRTFTVENTGTAALNLGANAVTLGNPGSNPFSVTSQPSAQVAAGASTTFAVTFVPTADGTFQDTVTIANDDADESPYAFAIQGSGYVSPDFFAQARKFAAGDRGAFDVFGISAAMDGDILVVGASGEDEDGAGGNTLLSAGAVYIFERNWGGSGSWGQVKKLVAADRGAGDQFGISVDIAGDTIVVGANQEDEDAVGGDTRSNAGAAYVFQRNQGGPDNWGQVKKLVAADRAADDNFGVRVAISGDTIVAGASQEDEDAGGANTLNAAGSAYIFQRDQGGTDNWGQVKKLVAADRAALDQFGGSLAIDGDIVVVTAIGEDEDAGGANTLSNAGSAYIFGRNQGGADNWGEVKKLVTADRAVNDFFGISAAVDGDTIVVGTAVEDEDAGGANTLNSAGSAYVFARNEGGADNWGQVKKLVAADRGADDQFGWRVDVDGDLIAVSAHQEDEDAAGGSTLANAGAAYLFRRNQGGAGNWGQVQKLVANDRGVEDHFGYSIALAGDRVFAGAYLEDEDATGANTLDGAGSAYLFASSPPADLVIAKSATLSRPAPGAAITYTIYFTNTGAGTAYAPIIRDSVPASVTVSAVTSSTLGSGVAIAQTGAAPDFAWTVGDLAAGQGGVITLTGSLDQNFGATTSITNTATITASHDITAANNSADASFTIAMYRVNTAAAGAGSGTIALNPPDGIYPAGTVVTVTATANPGAVFGGWSGDLTGSANPIALTMDGSKFITTTFGVGQYSVSTAVTGSGSGAVSLDPPGGVYPYGAVLTVTAAANPGSTFSGWSGDLTGSTTPATLTVTANRVVTASYGLNQYTISVSANPAAGGSAGGGGTVSHGSTVTVTAAAANGYTFINWTEGDSEVATSAAYVFTAGGNRALVANFSLNSYSINANTAGTGSGVVGLTPPGGTYAYGTVVTATATADPGSTFGGWSGSCTGSAQCILTIDAGKLITATFTRSSDPAAGVAVTKRASVNEAIVGETAVVYTYIITNTGTLPRDVTAFDDRLGSVPLVVLPGDTPQPVRTLAAGEAATGVLTDTPQLGDLPGPLASRVVVTGTAPFEPLLVTGEASVGVDLLLRPQAQSMCLGEAVLLHNTVETRSFGLVVIAGPAPADLLLGGVTECVPYSDHAGMIDLVNLLFKQRCPGGSACAPFRYLVFGPDGSSYSETVTGEQFAANIYLPLVSSTCESGTACP